MHNISEQNINFTGKFRCCLISTVSRRLYPWTSQQVNSPFQRFPRLESTGSPTMVTEALRARYRPSFDHSSLISSMFFPGILNLIQYVSHSCALKNNVFYNFFIVCNFIIITDQRLGYHNLETLFYGTELKGLVIKNLSTGQLADVRHICRYVKVVFVFDKQKIR